MSLLTKPPEAPKTYPEGRVCSHENCRTFLSRFNSGPLCFAHSKPERAKNSRTALADLMTELFGEE